jgi:hypothetical protein
MVGKLKKLVRRVQKGMTYLSDQIETWESRKQRDWQQAVDENIQVFMQGRWPEGFYFSHDDSVYAIYMTPPANIHVTQVSRMQ